MDSSLSQYAQNAVSLAQSSGYELYHYNNEITNMLAKGLTDRMLASVSGDIQSLIQSYLPQIKDVLSSNAVIQQDDGSTVLASIDKNATLADQILAAQQNVSTLESRVAAMKVTSAIEGKVLEVDIKKGETVGANTTAVVVADTDHVEVNTTVSSKDIKSLATGMDVVLISSDGYTKYIGVISRIGQKVISSSEGGENMTDMVVIPKTNMDELPGSSIDMEVVLSQKKNVNVVSLDCLTSDGNVFVVDSGNIAHKRILKKGLQDDYNVEITGGLATGEKVVLNPDKDLKDGQRVAIID
ncbi:MAG: HlyD family efflux transporter periplasmic adaptor subunit [Eubacteriales bacterium]